MKTPAQCVAAAGLMSALVATAGCVEWQTEQDGDQRLAVNVVGAGEGYPLDMQDHTGTIYRLTEAYLTINYMQLTLGRGVECDDIKERQMVAECSGDVITVREPISFDLISGRSADLLDFPLPAATYEHISMSAGEHYLAGHLEVVEGSGEVTGGIDFQAPLYYGSLHQQRGRPHRG